MENVNIEVETVSLRCAYSTHSVRACEIYILLYILVTELNAVFENIYMCRAVCFKRSIYSFFGFRIINTTALLSLFHKKVRPNR